MKMKGLSPIAISNAHISKTAYSLVNEIPNSVSDDEVAPSDDITGYYSYMAIQLNKRVNQFININYQRKGQATIEEFDEQLSLRLVAEVPCSLVGDVKSYL
jgi:phospholipase C